MKTDIDKLPFFLNIPITGEMVLHKISKTGDYGDLNNKPTIPAKTSDLENDSDFTTKKYVDDIVGNINTLLSEV